MKILACFFLISLSGCVLASANYDGFQRYENVGDMFSDLVNKTINDIAKNISEPLTVEDISLEFNDTNTLSGGANITNATLGGLSKMVAPFINVDIFAESIEMTVEIPELIISFNYWLDSVAGDLIPLYGSGSNSVTIDNLALNISGAVNTTDGIHVQNVSVVVSVGTATFNINGLLDNPEVSALINTVLTDNFCDFINNNRELISRVINAVIEKILNGAVKLDNLPGIFNEVDY